MMVDTAAMGGDLEGINADGSIETGFHWPRSGHQRPGAEKGTHPDRISRHAEHGNPVEVCRQPAVSQPQGRPIPRRGQDDPRSEGRLPKGTGNP
jgi:hypothetical protein